MTYSTQTCFAVLSVLLHVKPLVFFGMCVLLTGPSCITTFAHVRSCAVAYTRCYTQAYITHRTEDHKTWPDLVVRSAAVVVSSCSAFTVRDTLYVGKTTVRDTSGALPSAVQVYMLRPGTISINASTVHCRTNLHKKSFIIQSLYLYI